MLIYSQKIGKKRDKWALWLKQTFDTCFFCPAIAYAVHFSPANKINYQNVCNSFCLNQKWEGGQIMIEQILAIKTHQNLNIMQATSWFSPGLVRVFVFIEGTGKICKCQVCMVQQLNINNVTPCLLFTSEVNITQEKKFFSSSKKKPTSKTVSLKCCKYFSSCRIRYNATNTVYWSQNIYKQY